MVGTIKKMRKFVFSFLLSKRGNFPIQDLFEIFDLALSDVFADGIRFEDVKFYFITFVEPIRIFLSHIEKRIKTFIL